MKCPLMTAGRLACDLVTEYDSCDCLKEECAWWYEHPLTTIKDSGVKGECAILKIAKNTGGIGAR